MSAKHTKGPWELEEVESDCGRIKHLCPVDADGFSLLTVVEHNGVKFAAIYTEEDARLIAAAPRLLAELTKARAKLKENFEALIQSCSHPKTGLIQDSADLLFIESEQDLINSIDAAIAEATGAA
jgi:hypothetical protein